MLACLRLAGGGPATQGLERGYGVRGQRGAALLQGRRQNGADRWSLCTRPCH